MEIILHMIIILVKIHSWPTAIWHCSSTEMKCFFHDTSTRIIFISTWSSSTLLAIQMGDITCQTQSLRFEQSGQRFEWRARQGCRWRSWKRRGCSCQPPCWQQPHNHVLYDPAPLLSLSFCSTPAQLACSSSLQAFIQVHPLFSYKGRQPTKFFLRAIS